MKTKVFLTHLKLYMKLSDTGQQSTENTRIKETKCGIKKERCFSRINRERNERVRSCYTWKYYLYYGS